MLVKIVALVTFFINVLTETVVEIPVPKNVGFNSSLVTHFKPNISIKNCTEVKPPGSEVCATVKQIYQVKLTAYQVTPEYTKAKFEGAGGENEEFTLNRLKTQTPAKSEVQTKGSIDVTSGSEIKEAIVYVPFEVTKVTIISESAGKKNIVIDSEAACSLNTNCYLHYGFHSTLVMSPATTQNFNVVLDGGSNKKLTVTYKPSCSAETIKFGLVLTICFGLTRTI